jgi:hypothetical protein
MLKINQIGFHLVLKPLDFERLNYPSVQTDIEIYYDILNIKNHLHFKSIWFNEESLESLLMSLKSIIEKNNGLAEIKDMSEDFTLGFSILKNSTWLNFKSEPKSLSIRNELTIEVDTDTVNIAHRQFSDLLMEMR